MNNERREQITLLLNEDLKKKDYWPLLRQLLTVQYDEMSVREQKWIDELSGYGDLYWANRIYHEDGSESLTTDLGSPDSILNIRFPKGISHDTQILALNAAIKEIM